jgi:hypothetical protein
MFDILLAGKPIGLPHETYTQALLTMSSIMLAQSRQWRTVGNYMIVNEHGEVYWEL